MLSDIVDPNDSISKYTNNMFFFHFTFSYFIIYAYLKKHGHRLSSHNCNKKYIPKTHTHTKYLAATTDMIASMAIVHPFSLSPNKECIAQKKKTNLFSD